MNPSPEKRQGGPRARVAAPRLTVPGKYGPSSRFFQPETISALRQRLPEYLEACGVRLRKQGVRYIGLCPMHEDRSPSLAVFGTHHEMCGCYPCGFTGDVFKVSQWLGRAVTFPDALADVAATLGVYLPQSRARTATRPATASLRHVKPPESSFVLSDVGRDTVHAARLAFSDAFHSGDEIIDRIVADLGLERETLRLASWGRSGLGLAAGRNGAPVWLCYRYPEGLKWRNPDPQAKPRFDWLEGKATTPWRWEWACKPEIHTVYLTEGESDCMAFIQAGVETDGTTACVASPGTSFPREWAPLFTGKRVILCFDTDRSGQTATATVGAILKGHAAEILTWKENRRRE